jgi:hypothetical protein
LSLPLLAFSLTTLISRLESPSPRFSMTEVENALCGPVWLDPTLTGSEEDIDPLRQPRLRQGQ